MLKDLKNSRTLPILQPVTVASLDLNNYCMCNLSVVTINQPKIILPSPTPLLKESEVFYSLDTPFEKTSEMTPMTTAGVNQVMTPGSLTTNFDQALASLNDLNTIH